ncbi:MAG: carboxypeptidase regulatory-like domain-containing protein, partial [Nitrospirae bacterium]|nr:carboxypeptidase regulatory-like domain-containing protein [Nitrospirota bacterium]
MLLTVHCFLFPACSKPHRPSILEEPPPSLASGTVVNERLQPLTDVTITVSTQPGVDYETGETGEFSIPLDQPGYTQLTFAKAGHTRATRVAYPEPFLSISLGRVVMTALDTKVTTVGLEGGTATDSTGSYAVDIPPGALDRPADIRVTPLRSTAQTPMPMDAYTATAVDLQPSGLVFKKPVTVRMAIEGFSPGDGIPAFTFGYETGQFEYVGHGVVNEDGKTVDVSVTHFSYLCGWLCNPYFPCDTPSCSPGSGGGGGGGG